MARTPKTAAPKIEGIAPLVALHGINFKIEPGEFFIPTSEAERAHLLDGEFPAARELNDVELIVYGQTGGAVSEPSDEIGDADPVKGEKPATPVKDEKPATPVKDLD